jgi:hypothetical protein
MRIENVVAGFMGFSKPPRCPADEKWRIARGGNSAKYYYELPDGSSTCADNAGFIKDGDLAKTNEYDVLTSPREKFAVIPSEKKCKEQIIKLPDVKRDVPLAFDSEGKRRTLGEGASNRVLSIDQPLRGQLRNSSRSCPTATSSSCVYHTKRTQPILMGSRFRRRRSPIPGNSGSRVPACRCWRQRFCASRGGGWVSTDSVRTNTPPS